MGTITRNAANNFTTGGVILPAAINDTSVASISELENVAAGGAMTLISEQTASGSASISFTSGIDSTYPIYYFEIINIHAQNDIVDFKLSFTTDGINFNATQTSTFLGAYHAESDAYAGISYYSGEDVAQSSPAGLADNLGADDDQSFSGTLTLFNPSSTTFVKHWLCKNSYGEANALNSGYQAGYVNTTNAVTGVRFQMASGNIDSGTIKLYGISGS